MKQETLEEAAEIFVKNRFTKQICNDESYPDIYASKEAIVESHILFAKWQAEKTKETIFDKVDYKLLAKQKMLLIELNNTTNIDGLDGLIYFLDAFQDEAVDMHGKSETEVFALEGGQDE